MIGHPIQMSLHLLCCFNLSHSSSIHNITTNSSLLVCCVGREKKRRESGVDRGSCFSELILHGWRRQFPCGGLSRAFHRPRPCPKRLEFVFLIMFSPALPLIHRDCPHHPSTTIGRGDSRRA